MGAGRVVLTKVSGAILRALAASLFVPSMGIGAAFADSARVSISKSAIAEAPGGAPKIRPIHANAVRIINKQINIQNSTEYHSLKILKSHCKYGVSNFIFKVRNVLLYDTQFKCDNIFEISRGSAYWLDCFNNKNMFYAIYQSVPDKNREFYIEYVHSSAATHCVRSSNHADFSPLRNTYLSRHVDAVRCVRQICWFVRDNKYESLQNGDEK